MSFMRLLLCILHSGEASWQVMRALSFVRGPPGKELQPSANNQ